MNHRLSQNYRYQQKMALTPKMKHSIQMLGMSVQELNDYIDGILASNPFLQKQIDECINGYERDRSIKPAITISSEDNQEIDRKQDVDPREFFLSQLRILNLSAKDLEIAEYLIYEMDEGGYIKSDPEDVARDTFSDAENVDSVLDIIQSMDPPGIGARNIRECLQLQLKRMRKEDSLEYRIVADFITDLAVNDIQKITKSLGVSREDVQRAVDNIKSLNPRPGTTLLSRKTDDVIPDLIAKVSKNKVRLELNRETTPRLRLYNPYADKTDVVKDPEARAFLKENMEVAKHLLDNIKRREDTMCRVANYVLNVQKENIADDNYGLNALTVKDVARMLDLHTSTVSRTLSNKFIQINDKVFSLKSLLSQGMKKENGDITSKATIKKRIRELVDAEDKAKPLKDSAIEEKLAQEGITIKRRTVAKYRESLHILPTHLRRKKP